jgi:crossover junction endodeoxyribonuclease RuvC
VPKALTLDIATVTGFAHDDEAGTRPITGTFRVPRPTGSWEDGWEFGATFAGFEEFLVPMVKLVRPDVAGIEAPLNIVQGDRSKVRTNQNTIRILFGLAAIAEKVFHQCGVRVYETNVMTAKKYLAGHGRADKGEMIAAARRLGWTVNSADAADAAGQWGYLKSLTDKGWAPRSTPLFGVRA